ncbi:MAG: nitrilase-related carbon-nitrogen hydrolase, partial [Phycisphaerales bacterium]
MRIALARFDALVGDPDGNALRLADAAERAVQAGAGCVAFPELAICGYPPRDLLQRRGFVDRCTRALAELASALASRGCGNAAVLVGTPAPGPAGRPVNGVAVLRAGRVECVHAKRLLPQYDVFDEPRHFDAGSAPTVIDVGGVRLGILACEDLWRGADASGAGSY